MRCISVAYVGTRCPSVRLSVTFVDHVKTNKHIFEIFSPSGSHTILVFPHQTGRRYFHGNGGVECRWGIGRNSDSGLSKIAGRAKCRKHLPTTKLSIWHSRPRTTGYPSIAGRANYIWSDKNSYRRPYSVDRTVGNAPANVCDGLQHVRIRRREENRKEFNCTQCYIWSRNN